MRFPFYTGNALNYRQMWELRTQTDDYLHARGTNEKPQAPRGIKCQGGPSSILVTWSAPQLAGDVAGYKVYRDKETNLIATIFGQTIRQATIPATALASSSPVVNVYVSSFNKLGIESDLVSVQGSAANQTGTPGVPIPPTGGGSDPEPLEPAKLIKLNPRGL